MFHQFAVAANFSDNALSLLVGRSFLTSAVKSVSDKIEINESDTLAGLQYVRHFNSETALQVDYLSFGTVTLTGPALEQFFTQNNQRVDLANDALFKVSTQSLALSAQFRSWFSWSWAAQISLGLQHWQRRVEYRNLINNPSWPENKAGNSVIWSLGMVHAISNFEMSLNLGSAHFGDDAIMHSQQLVFSVGYGF